MFVRKTNSYDIIIPLACSLIIKHERQKRVMSTILWKCSFKWHMWVCVNTGVYIEDRSPCIFPIHVSLISHGQFKYLYNNHVITLIFTAWLTQFIAFSDGDNGAEIFNYFVMDFSTCIHYIYAITVPLTIITCRHYIAFFNDLVAILQLQKNSIRFQ